MSKGGAYYAAAGIANQSQPVQYGEIALGFAKASEAKRLEAKADERYRQEIMDKSMEKWGDEIFGEFDGTGIDNIDGVASKVKDQVKRHAETLNALYEEGKISQSQLNSRLRKLSNDSKSYRGIVGQVAQFLDENEKLGGKASKYNEEVIKQLENFRFNMVPVVDENSNIAFLTEDGEKGGINKTELSKFGDMLRAKQGIDDQDIFSDIMKGLKPNTRVIRNKAGNIVGIKESYIDGDSISTNTENYLKSMLESKTDDELIDMAIKNGVDYGKGLMIEDQAKLKSDLLKVYREKTKEYLLDKDVNNEKDAVVMKIQEGNFRINLSREGRDKKEFDKKMRTVMDPKSGTFSGNGLNPQQFSFDVGEGKSYATTEWNFPIDKAFDVKPFLETGTELMDHAQITQLKRVAVPDGAGNITYKWIASVYLTKNQDKIDWSQIALMPGPEKEKYLESVTGQNPKESYRQIEIPVETVNKFEDIFDEKFTEPKTDLNSIITGS